MVQQFIVPYNESMQLGQGFNSFLQIPCFDYVVKPADPDYSMRARTPLLGRSEDIKPSGFYSWSFVDKLSEVAHSMNITAAAVIKSGTMAVSGGSVSLDEGKFLTSDMNAVIGVRVMNPITGILEEPEFVPPRKGKMTSQESFEIYGDCYISGFIEGGDLHGLVSVKVSDAAEKSHVETAIRNRLENVCNPDRSVSDEPSDISTSEFAAVLDRTDTAVTVNWTGGGQIKAEDEEWSLDTLCQSASSFPSRVATCPGRVWAVLTRYTDNRTFVEWAKKNDIVVPNFDEIQHTIDDLLDDFMGHKRNLARLNVILREPTTFQLSPCEDPVQLDVKALITERKLIKNEISKISQIIDEINGNPLQHPVIDIKSPTSWARRLPVPVHGSIDRPADPY